MEPLKQYIWEAVPGAENASHASELIASNHEAKSRDIAAETQDPIEAFAQLGRAYGQAFGKVAQAIGAFVDGYHKAYSQALAQTQKDYEVSA